MSSQPRLSSINLWSSHERIFTNLLRQALSALADEATDKNEIELNRCLYRAIIHASYEAERRGEHIPAVVLDGRNPPDSSDLERAERESKIPDLIWGYIDPHADDPNDAAKHFVVECKRLTEPPARYAREYVVSGIARFVRVSHGYGKGMASGAMIGYLQEVYLDDALARVNAVAQRNSAPPLFLRAREGEEMAELDHYLIRSFHVSPFHLTHIWGRIGPDPSS